MKLEKAREKIANADRQMAKLFEERMEAVKAVADYKKEHGLPVEDKAQETKKISEIGSLIGDPELRPYYASFLQSTMEISKRLQQERLRRQAPGKEQENAVLRMELGPDSYDIVLERGCLHRAGELLDLNRKVMIVTGELVPRKYAETVAGQCTEPFLHIIPSGEESKSFAVLEDILVTMLNAGFTRSDCVCAVGGGVVGDLAGFAAACYMRGIDFYNVPTTVLSQVDSSIGGKTAVNLRGVKNMAGAFWQPKKVLIDPDTLSTLPPRHITNGLAEALKAGLIADEKLFSLFETEDAATDTEKVIEAALRVKKKVVEADERENGLRKILNFGHTIGHGIESVTGMLHGESVALGMIPMCSDEVRARLIPVLEKLGLPLSVRADPDTVFAAVMHDKKMSAGKITVVKVPVPGSYKMESVLPEDLKDLIKMVVHV
ncbi:MAG: 3-dehydroquinate synthase [Oscillospiraceae bacterium]|nr:3-dehydroquinate synthase [Oscillospiraceae bacterium]